MSTKKQLQQAVEELPESVSIEEALGRICTVFRTSLPSTLDVECVGLEDMPAPPRQSAAEQKKRVGRLLRPVHAEDKNLKMDRAFVSRESKKLLQRLDAGR